MSEAVTKEAIEQGRKVRLEDLESVKVIWMESPNGDPLIAVWWATAQPFPCVYRPRFLTLVPGPSAAMTEPTGKLPVEQMEQYVLKRWASVLAANTYAPGTTWEIYIYGDSVPNGLGGMQRPTLKIIAAVNKGEAWQAAYAFTIRREQEIREKREEIKWVHREMEQCVNTIIPQRLISILEAQLAELLKGFREQ